MATIVMQTGYEREQTSQAAAVQLADGVLAKPLTLSSLFDAVVEAQSRRLGGTSPLVAEIKVGAAAARLDGLHLLLVEDNAINQEVAQFILEDRGATVEIVGDGRQAVERLSRGADGIDLVLMDVQMPEMDGFQATRLIRGTLGLAQLPIIALTAGARDADREQCGQSGMNDFIAKPFDVDQMLGVILRYAGKGAAMPPVFPRPAEPEAAATPQGQLPVLDRRQGLMRTGGDEAQLDSLLRKVVDSNEATLAELRRELAEGATELAARRMHMLRGAAGNVAAIRLATLATQTEAAIIEGRDDDLASLLEALTAAADDLRQAVELLKR
jgi:hypothetical protein